ncbi:MAG: hypothetical protein IPI11_00975 [Haliscomenobacter sp.]|nr:hypothetical protein [Haliscomenobacter sp.]
MDMTFLYGLIGGLLPDAIRIINNRYNPVLPEYLKSPSFYIGTLFLVVLGGGAAFLLQADSVVDALAMGYSAPQIVSSVLQQKANIIAPPVGGRQEREEDPRCLNQSKETLDEGWWGM